MIQKLMTIAAFCKTYSVSRSTYYRLVEREQLRNVKIGGAARIKVEDANSWYESLESDNDE